MTLTLPVVLKPSRPSEKSGLSSTLSGLSAIALVVEPPDRTRRILASATWLRTPRAATATLRTRMALLGL